MSKKSKKTRARGGFLGFLLRATIGLLTLAVLIVTLPYTFFAYNYILAQFGNTSAQYRMATRDSIIYHTLMFGEESGRESRDRRRAKWLPKAAENGHTTAQWELAKTKEEAKHYADAIHLYKKAAAAPLGAPVRYDSILALARLYLDGEFEASQVPVTKAEALEWLVASSTNAQGFRSRRALVDWATEGQGSAEILTQIAQYDEAVRRYYQSHGGDMAKYRSVKADILFALTRDAEGYSTDGKAAYALGKAYGIGFLAEKDLIEAAKWYEKAAKKGHEDARAKLAALQNPAAPENVQSQTPQNKAADDPLSRFTRSLSQ